MALDMAALRRKAAELNGQRGKSGGSSVQLYKPGLGEHRIRCLPWPNPDQGMPIMERSFYSLGEIRQFLAPSQFGHEDPVEEFRRKLFESKDPESKILAKNLFPKVYGYLPVIDRADEAKGIQIWKMNKFLYQKMFNYFLDEEVGDYLDLEKGFDVKIKVTQVPGKKYKGNDVLDLDAEPARNSTPASTDPKKLQAWLDAIPKLDDLHPYTVKSLPEVKALLKQWLDGDASPSETETSKGPAPENAVDALSKELSEKKTAVADVKKKKDEKPVKDVPAEKAKATPVASAEEDESPVDDGVKLNLDDAFADLMGDD